MSETIISTGLNILQVMRAAFHLLHHELGGKEITFEKEAACEIGNDSDYHRNRVAYTVYDFADMIRINSRLWAITFGTPTRGYLGEPYCCDISAFLIPEKGTDVDLSKAVRSMVKDSCYFSNALIIAMSSGTFQCNPNNVLSGRVGQILKPVIEQLVDQPVRVSPKLFSLSTLRPVVESAAIYKPALPGVLVDAFIKILSF